MPRIDQTRWPTDVGASHGLHPARTRELIDRFPNLTVLVVGDVMLDHFLFGRVSRISPEAPVPIVEFERDEYRLGGAANVAATIRALGATPLLVAAVGADPEGDRLRTELRRLEIASDGLLTDESRCTTTKRRIVTERNQHVARVDYETDADLTPEVEAGLLDRLGRAAATVDAIVISDYLKGVVTRAVAARAIERARARAVPAFVDPKIPHLDYYSGASLITPNYVEAQMATHTRIRTDEDAQVAARLLRRRCGCRSVLITRGEHGMWLLEGAEREREQDEPAILAEVPLPAAAREVADVTGAGDTVIATLALGVAAGASLTEAAELANYAAGLVVGKFGPATVLPEELLDAAASSRK